MWDYVDNMGMKYYSFWFQIRVIFSFTEDCFNYWQFYFKCRCITWRAACVESLFPLLLTLLRHVSLSHPKFPSFRERSEARDCDLPWGWVKDAPLTSLSWEIGFSYPSLYFVYTWVPYSFSDQLTECRKRGGIQFPALFWIVRTDQWALHSHLYRVIVHKEKREKTCKLSWEFWSCSWR